MKRTLRLLPLFFLFSFKLHAQQLSAVYEVTKIMQLPDEALRNGMNKTIEISYSGFLFRKDNSYLNYIKPKDLLSLAAGEKGIITKQLSDNYSFRYDAPADTIDAIGFTNLDSNYLKRYNASTGKNFCAYFNGTAESAGGWDLLPDTKEILGLKCRKAIRYHQLKNGIKTTYAEVWYTNDIEWDNRGAGIEGIRNAPGFIVEANVIGTHRKWMLKEYNTHSSINNSQLWVAQLNGACNTAQDLNKEIAEKAKEASWKQEADKKKRLDILNQ